MRVKRILFVNRAPFGNLDLDFTDKRVISLTGINGSGKTTILSYIVDAFYEIAKKTFHNEFSGVKNNKFYRIMSSLYNIDQNKCSLVYILFDYNGKDIHYIDLIGITSKEVFNGLMLKIWGDLDENNWPIKFDDISFQLTDGSQSIKYSKIDNNDSKKVFENNILTYFPSYRYEQPGYLNDVYQIELLHKITSEFSGYLPNPIEITSDLPQIANWLLDLVLDGKLYGPSEEVVKLNIDIIISNILLNKLKSKVNIAIGTRNLGGARIQIYDSEKHVPIYPSIFNISAGEASLLCIFGEIVKQADKIGKSRNFSSIEGIVIVDEVDKHLHIKLQKEVLPVLINMFPKIQFILSTHSPFVNMGLSDKLGSSCSIIDLDSGGRVCEASENDVFCQAYDVMIRENDRYANLCRELEKQLSNLTKPIVYLEGETDEKYFNKALEVFGYTDINIEFKWIGHYNVDNGKAEFSGKDSMNSAISFFKGNKPNTVQVFLFDCDTNKKEFDDGNIVVMTMPFNDKDTKMNKGIENALELEEMKSDDFYEEHIVKKDYGNTYISKELDKMKLCNYICGLDIELQKRILMNLKPIIEKIINRLNK